ncbi:MAG: hypothetical protein WC451_01240 [Patescibacteria group bacterium]
MNNRAEVRTAKKPCPTCGNTGAVGGNDLDYNGPIHDCPDCDRGRQNRIVHGRVLTDSGQQPEP